MSEVSILKDYARMCDALIKNCEQCRLNGGFDYDRCQENILENPEKAVEIVKKWAKEHPLKTRQSKFLEHYPDAIISEDGVIDIAPCVIEKSRFRKNSRSICNTPEKLCGQCRHEYWNEEVE